MITLKTCPMPECGGDLSPHCIQNVNHKWFSSQCDIVVCVKCRNRGKIDGRYWPVDRFPLNSVYPRVQDFDELQQVVNSLRADIEDKA